MEFKNLCAFILIILIITILQISKVQAQGLYLSRGKNGFGAEAGVAVNKSALGFAGTLGFSFRGMLDLSISIEQVKFKEKILDSDLSSTGIGPTITIFPFKNNIITISASLAFQTAYFSGKIVRTGIESIRSNSVGGSLFLYHSKLREEKTSFIPFLGISYISTQIVSDRSTISMGDGFVGSFGFNIGLKLKSSNLIFISPTFLIQEPFREIGQRDLTISFSVGYLIL